MFDFLKICGIGVLTIVLSPVWIAILAIYAVYCLLLFLFTMFRTIYIDLRNLFVKDKTKIVDPLGKLPEDYEAKRIMDAQEAVFVNLSQGNNQPAFTTTTTEAEVTAPTTTHEETPFIANYDSSFLSEEDNQPSPIQYEAKDGDEE